MSSSLSRIPAVASPTRNRTPSAPPSFRLQGGLDRIGERATAEKLAFGRFGRWLPQDPGFGDNEGAEWADGGRGRAATAERPARAAPGEGVQAETGEERAGRE